MIVDDVNKKGIKLDVPGEPLHDPAFIGALNAAYDLGRPGRAYPERGSAERVPAGLRRRSMWHDYALHRASSDHRCSQRVCDVS